jgi:Flp pilus assembly protein TadD
VTPTSRSIDRKKVAYCRARAERHPDSPDGQRETGEYFVQAGLPAEALAPVERLVALEPADLIAQPLRSVVFVELGRFADAESESVEVVRRDPRSTAVFHNLDLLCFATDQPDKAGQQFQRVVHQEPDNPKTLNDLAVLYALPDQQDQARDAFDRCLTLGWNYREGWLNAIGRPPTARSRVVNHG